jgi:uncharacterized protein (DUF1778 family)
MSKKLRDRKIDVRVAQPLAAELERAAEAEGRSTSDYVRRVLIEHVIQHAAATLTESAAQAT